ncbi:MAG: AI-2E family transporter [Chloroflexi bacterium]|nr:AI-2E family transporter [Chloroflexota bacterium]
MERSRLLNILLVLLIFLAGLVLAQMLWQLLSGFADIILLFILGWILSFVLDPLVSDLAAHPVPLILLDLLRPVLGESRTKDLAEFHLSRSSAVALVYLGLLVAIMIVVILFVPPTAMQLTQIASQLPELMTRVPVVGIWVEEQLARFGIRVDVVEAARSALTVLQGAASTLVQNALGIFTGLLAFLANVFVVLILSFYITLDGTRVRHLLLDLVPESLQRETNYLSQSVNRTFGGFIRGQLVQALLQGIGTAVALEVLGLDFVLAASLFAVLFMLIPLVGPFLALLPPLLVVLFQAPELSLWLFIALFVYQFVIVNVFMPRVLSKAIGLHPLLVFAAILIGIKVGGFWGAFFGIPVAGVLWAMVVFLFEQWQRDRAAHGDAAVSWMGPERRLDERRRAREERAKDASSDAQQRSRGAGEQGREGDTVHHRITEE